MSRNIFKPIISALLLLGIIITCAAQNVLTLRVNTNNLGSTEGVSVIGDVLPLMWENEYPLSDVDQDGIFEATINFNTNKPNLQFKFKANGKIELEGSDPRVIWFNDGPKTEEYIFNEYSYLSPENIDKLRLTEKEIEADVKLLKKIIQYIHPSIYKFRDSAMLQEDFKILEHEIKRNPTLVNAYGSISKFAAKIKCSHTFTNPWNQNSTIKKALFHQPDKIPFTFSRIGQAIYIDKNASTNKKLEKGLAIVSINGMDTEDVLARLAKYVTSDGNNFEKKLERLTVTGEEKFALFDIFYPIEFGSPGEFQLVLLDLKTESQFTATVSAISKTKRTKILLERYGNVATSLRDGWNFAIMDEETARLSIKSFAVQRNEFDWKDYLENVFNQLKKHSISNFIIDIRGNEGGQGEVGEFILKRILQKPFKVQGTQSTVAYLSIPDEFKKYMSTWDKFPYDFHSKISGRIGGKFLLKQKYTVKAKTYKPMKNGFKGQVFLLTDAANSSATHIMASYAKQIEHMTIVGQETGGNQLGINGSFIFFLKLPNTKVELDIPVINMVIPMGKSLEDGGIKPDVEVKKNPMDLIDGTDTELQKVLEIIKSK